MKSLQGFVIAVLLTTFSAGAGLADDHLKHLNSGKILPTNLPFSELVISGDMLFLSGQIGSLPGTLKLAEGGIEGESKQVMNNIKTSLETHGYTLSNLVKCTVILSDMEEWGAFNEIYDDYFEDGKFPARATFAASGLVLGARVEVDCIGAK
ncbi:MAG: RidA family protein [Pseudomonadota bacterium]